MNYKFLLLGLLVVSLFGCKATKLAKGEAPKPQTEAELMRQLISNQVKANWFSAKARIEFDDGYIQESFSANIRMLKDSLIWMNFTKFSLEGGRMLITPDSVFFIDRINSQVLVKPFEYLNKNYHLPVGFQGLQALLLGNPVFFSSQTSAEVDSNRYLLIQNTDRFEALYWLEPQKVFLNEFKVRDKMNHRKLTVTATDFKDIEGKQKFSYFRTFHLLTPDMGEVKLKIEYSKVEINVPKSIEFNIPARYEKVD